MTTSLRKIALAGVSALAVGLASAASAAPIQLGFILDRSGSIGAPNWTTIVNGLSQAMSLIPQGGQYEVSVVSFASTAAINVDSFLITDAASVTTLQGLITGIVYTGGSTNMAAGFSEMQTALTNGGAVGTAYVNLATDGVPDSEAAATAAAAALVAAGVDNLSVEGIGGGVNQAYLTGSICSPQPCTVGLAAVNFPTQGFYIAVADANAYATAIGEKIQIVTTPEPVSMAIFGMGLAGLGFAAARRRKAA